MRELEDLRGRTLSWLVSRRFPLLCALSSNSGGAGSLVQDVADDSIGAFVAGVRWTVRHGISHDAVSFENGPTVAEARVWAGGYEVEIDGVSRYRFGARRLDHLTSPELRYRKAWIDAQERHAVLFKPYRHSRHCESGEILVSATATVEHVPILAIVGVVHLTMRRVSP